MGTPNWTALVSQGRAKAHGVPWTAEEILLVLEIAKLNVSRESAAEFVRNGVTSLEDYQAMVTKKEDIEPVKPKSPKKITSKPD